MLEGAARLGRGRDGRAPDRHVRLRAVGPRERGRSRWCATGSASSRSTTARNRRRCSLFGSELKALRAVSRLDADDRPRRARRLSAATATCRRRARIYRGIRKLPPGTILTLRARRGAGDRRASGTLRDVALDGLAQAASRHRTSARRSSGSTRCCATPSRRHDRRRAARRLPVRRHRLLDRRRADAGAERPAGAHASRSASTSRATTRRRTPSAVAAHLGTDHTELYVDAGRRARRDPEAAATVRRAVRRLVADPDLSSCRSWRAGTSPSRCRATAATSCSRGYNRYFWAEALWRRLGRVPRAAAQRSARPPLRALSPGAWDCMFDLRAGARPPAAAGRQAAQAGEHARPRRTRRRLPAPRQLLDDPEARR